VIKQHFIGLCPTAAPNGYLMVFYQQSVSFDAGDARQGYDKRFVNAHKPALRKWRIFQLGMLFL
jgi:hypothetical protein